MMDEAHEYWLLAKGFRKVTAIAEYTKELKEEPVIDGQIMAHSLAEVHISEAEYGALYEQCRSGSANKNEVQAVAEVMYMLQGELGPGWREYCHYFTTRGETVGISIPHIEPGTDSEGRMFYFGVMPNARGRGTGTKLHQHSLRLLRQLRASYYIGSTDVSNRDMIRVFEKNGCKQIDRKGIYRMEK
jgi:ribosomal protein S18 acetylase RimI-like enzyme